MDEKMREMGIRAKHAAGVLATLTTEEKNAGLLAIADALRARRQRLWLPMHWIWKPVRQTVCPRHCWIGWR